MEEPDRPIPVDVSNVETAAILRDVEGQIDQERAHQQVLEAQIKEALLVQRQAKASVAITEKNAHSPTRKSSTKVFKKAEEKVSKELLSLQAQVDGMRRLTEALCEHIPAVTAAREREIRRNASHPSKHSQYPQNMLSVEAIRLLEIQPWHPTAVKHSQATDSVFEWQYWNPIEENWEGALSSFPNTMLFHKLPVLLPVEIEKQDTGSEEVSRKDNSTKNPIVDQTGDEKSETDDHQENKASVAASISSETAQPAFDLQSLLAGLLPSTTHAAQSHQHDKQSPSKYNIRNKYGPVLTNTAVTHRLSLDATTGFTLPDPSESGGTWKWLGWWKIEHIEPPQMSRDEGSDDKGCSETNALDPDGWIYAREASHHHEWNASKLCWGTLDDENYPPPVLRRRKWIRKRVLVDYPLACEATQEYLQLTAKNATMVLAMKELKDKLSETMDQDEQVQEYAATTHKNNQIELTRYQLIWELQEERIKSLRYGRFQRKIEELACTPEDILPILSNPELFGHLQGALRNSGAITNAMLQQGIHFYIQDHIRERELHTPPINDDQEGLEQDGDTQSDSDDDTSEKGYDS